MEGGRAWVPPEWGRWAEDERFGDRLRLRSRSTATGLEEPGETTTAGFFLEARGGGATGVAKELSSTESTESESGCDRF